MKRLPLLFFLLSCAVTAVAQDFNATIRINGDQLQMANKTTLLKNLEMAIFDFVNNRKWSQDKITNAERIDCNFIFIISKVENSDQFTAKLDVQSSRPIYGAGYNSPLLNIQDEDIQFKYSEFQSLDYVEGQNVSNLTSIIAFYLYVIMGMDYDSYSKDGGSIYYSKANQIVNSCQSAPETGWKAFEKTRNRYWLIENLTGAAYKDLHEALYKYHRLGLDVMGQTQNKNPEGPRAEIMQALELVKKVFKAKPNAMILSVFFFAKSDEIVNIFKSASGSEKNKALELLNEINIQNTSKWQTILK